MTGDQSATPFNYSSTIRKACRLPTTARESEMWIDVLFFFKWEVEEKKLGISYWSRERENNMRCGCVLCCQRDGPLIIRLFILFFSWSQWIQSTHRAVHMREVCRDLVRDPKIKWVIKLPLWLCVPAQLWLIFARENKVVCFICMLKILSLSFSLSLSLSLSQHYNYLECEMLFRYS